MSSSLSRKRRYSFIYKIYRRVRYVRFLRKRRKQIKKELQREEKLQKRQNRKAAKTQRKQEVRLAREKRKVEKKRMLEQQVQIRTEITETLKEEEEIQKQIRQKHQQMLEREKDFQKRKRRRLLKVYFRAVRKNLINSIKAVNVSSFRRLIKGFRESSLKRRQFMTITVSSLALFLLSYLTMFIMGLLATAVAGLFFNYPGTIYYWNVYFNITVDEWTPESIKTIYLAGPGIVAIVGILAMIIYSNLKELTFHFKLFYLWCVVHALTMFFGAMLVGMLFETGVGYAVSWMYVTDTGKLLYSMLSIFILVIAGFTLTRPFLFSANTFFNSLNDNNRALFLHAQVTVPYLLGVGILILLRQPQFLFYDTFITFTTVLILLPLIGSAVNYGDMYFEDERKPLKIQWMAIIAAILAIGFFRIVLGIGLPIG